DQAVKLRLAGGDPLDRLGAAAPGSAPADAVLLQQHDLEAPLGQVQGGRAAGNAAAHDTDVRVHPAGQRSPPGGGVRVGRVLGIDITEPAHRSSRAWECLGYSDAPGTPDREDTGAHPSAAIAGF